MGIGLNVNGTGVNRIVGIRAPAITLEEYLRHPTDRAEVLCRVLESLEQLYRSYCVTGPDDLLAQWRSMDVCLGHWITAIDGATEIQGRAVGLRDDGALQIAPPHGPPIFLLAGDVSVHATGPRC